MKAFDLMDPRKLFTKYGLDERLAGEICAYCGSPPNTVDHVPSKILLDDPLPGNLPVVPACTNCNGGFSRDEEYLACFLECVLAGTTEADDLRRTKVQKALRHSSALAKSIQTSARVDSDGRLVWVPDMQRVENVVLKLARGHALYELGTPCLEPPDAISCFPLTVMTDAKREQYESGPEFRGWPEIGSRAFLRAAGIEPYANRQGSDWVTVQDGRYRYSVEDSTRVRIVLSEYLACVIEWEG